MLNYRLTYSVRVNEGRMSRTAKLVLVLFTDHKVLGCVEVEIPVQPIDAVFGRPLTGDIEFVPAFDPHSWFTSRVATCDIYIQPSS